MGVDAARRDEAAGGVDLARAAGRPLAELHDAAAGDADVGVEGVAGGGHAGIAHHEVEAGRCSFVVGKCC